MTSESALAPHGGDPQAQAGSPDYIRAHGNQLLNEQSLYLQQHAHNPVDWYPWGPAALERAVADDKPVFLSIGYSSCHWCHVMEEEVFEYNDIAAYLNEHFVCIKLDREERPDLDEVYMRAALMMNGSGGWPLNLFLTPQLKPFFAGTYIPHDEFLMLAQRVIEIRTTEPERLHAGAEELAGLIAATQTQAAGEVPGLATVEQAVLETVGRFDTRWGGFSSQQKFPIPVRWLTLLHHYRRTGDPAIGDQLRLTLDNMAGGGLYDQLGGGFHRYCTDMDWTVPHFEKMLYDNAQLVSLFTEAAVVFAEPRYQQVAQETLAFMLRELRDPDGAFYASFDADSGGEEGTFYVWTPAELIAVCGAENGAALALLLGVTEAGNFEGSNVLTQRADLAEVAKQLNRKEPELVGLLAKYRPALLEKRGQRIAPGLDRKVVTAWNGLAISAFAQAYAAFGDDEYKQAAEQAADYLWRVHGTPQGRLARASTNGQTSGEGIIDDYACLANSLLELYSATGNQQHYQRAVILVEYADAHFAAAHGEYYLTHDEVVAPLGRQITTRDSVEPSGNAMLLLAVARLAALAGDEARYQQLDEVLAYYSNELSEQGMEMGWWFDLVQRLNGPFYDVVIAGDPAQASTQALLAEFHTLLPPHAVLSLIPGEGVSPEQLAMMPPLAGRSALKGQATAYVCRRGSCNAPTQDPAELARQLMEGWAY